MHGQFRCNCNYPENGLERSKKLNKDLGTIPGNEMYNKRYCNGRGFVNSYQMAFVCPGHRPMSLCANFGQKYSLDAKKWHATATNDSVTYEELSDVSFNKYISSAKFVE